MVLVKKRDGGGRRSPVELKSDHYYKIVGADTVIVCPYSNPGNMIAEEGQLVFRRPLRLLPSSTRLMVKNKNLL